MDWSQVSILITGGTGSFGHAFIATLLKDLHPRKIIVFSRDELKQHEMRLGGFDHPSLRYFIGDMRDQRRLRHALEGVDIVVHAAALKHVPACEYNPFEAVQTNIIGAQNLIEAAIDTGVKKIMAISTDKAVNPVNLYGATKFVAEKVFVRGNAYSGTKQIRFSCVRYGNVVGSRGSVIPLFLKQKEKGVLTLTDERMTRFWITLPQAVNFVIRSIERMRGGEVFIPKIPSMRLTDLADAIAPGSKKNIVGIRPGEKLHEILLSEDEARHTVEDAESFVIQPEAPSWTEEKWPAPNLAEGFRYLSNTNTEWLSREQLAEMVTPSESLS